MQKSNDKLKIHSQYEYEKYEKYSENPLLRITHLIVISLQIYLEMRNRVSSPY